MRTAILLALTGALAGGCPALAQSATPLQQLLAEAAENNSDLHAAEHAWRAATHVREQASALPNPQLTLQEFSVGSPRPFAGIGTSNFAYIGIGASQGLPYPGKRGLRGQAADAEAEVQHTRIGVLQARIAKEIKADYFRLAFFQQTLALLESSRTTLCQMIDTEMARYSSGMGYQSDVLKAQLERTNLVREITMRHENTAEVEADLKQLLHRSQDSPDILAEDPTFTAFRHGPGELQEMTRRRNPEVRMEASSVSKESAALKSVERESKPDFSVGYVYQRTGFGFPAYYMLTLGMIVPRRSSVRAHVAEVNEGLAGAKAQMDAALQQQLRDTQKQYAAESSTSELVSEYREGLIPQAEALFRAGLAAYQSNKQPLASVLEALNQELQLRRDCQQAVLDHELAIAQLEELTGETLR